MLGRAQNTDIRVGDVVIELTSGMPFEVVSEPCLNDIAHVRLQCCADDSRHANTHTKTIAKSMLHLSFARQDNFTQKQLTGAP